MILNNEFKFPLLISNIKTFCIILTPKLYQKFLLKYIFNYYKLEATEKEFLDSTPNIANKLRTHYQKVTNELGYKISPPAEFIDYIALDALSKKYYEKAEALLKFNMENYPESYRHL